MSLKKFLQRLGKAFSRDDLWNDTDAELPTRSRAKPVLLSDPVASPWMTEEREKERAKEMRRLINVMRKEALQKRIE